MGVDFQNVAVARVLGMSDLPKTFWYYNSNAKRSAGFHMLIKHVQIRLLQCNTAFCVCFISMCDVRHARNTSHSNISKLGGAVAAVSWALIF